MQNNGLYGCYYGFRAIILRTCRVEVEPATRRVNFRERTAQTLRAGEFLKLTVLQDP